MRERITKLSCEEFAERVASRTGVPGGGATSALVGAVGVALCSMAGAFTQGKPRYAPHEGTLARLMEEAEDVRERLLELVEEDAEGFAPVTAALALPASDPERPAALERATEGACMAPLAMMGECCRAIILLEKMGEVCSRLLLSDVASGALIVRAALEAACVNVYVNTTMLSDRDQAGVIEAAASELIEEYVPRAQALALRVCDVMGAGGAL